MTDILKTPLLETRDLKKYFKVGNGSLLHAVDNINLKLYPGETLGVVGESGCGKSTIAGILAGKNRADGGKDFLQWDRHYRIKRQKNETSEKRNADYFPGPLFQFGSEKVSA